MQKMKTEEKNRRINSGPMNDAKTEEKRTKSIQQSEAALSMMEPE